MLRPTTSSISKVKADPQDSLQESWVEITSADASGSNGDNGLHRVNSVHNEKSLQSLLIEAQRESRNASSKGSKESSQRNSPKELTSPTVELGENGSGKEKKDVITASDFIWDWSSRIEPYPPKEWKLIHPNAGSNSSGSSRDGYSSALSAANVGVVKKGFFSKQFLPILIITNIVSLVIGAGLGVFIGKRLASSATSSPTLTMLYLD